MKVLKFDAIYKPTGEHFTPKKIDIPNQIVVGNFDGAINDWCYFSLDGSRGDVILREYTGLKDKNGEGKEIFAGDVLLSKDGRKGVVIWAENWAMWSVFGEALMRHTDGEVIGNCYHSLIKRG